MLHFSNCKINLGLNVIEKRLDGFHNIQTSFYPINWFDVLEVIEVKKGSIKEFELTQSGNSVDCEINQNLVYKAWQIISSQKKIPPIKVHLHKKIPIGAGLAGGSSNAAYFINLLNSQFNLSYSQKEKLNIAEQLGSDCAFFIENKAVYAEEKGNKFSELKIDLSNYYIFLVYPNIQSDTSEAYKNLICKSPIYNLKYSLENYDVKKWKDYVTNDFESSIFKKHPEIKNLKAQMYDNGALYASMSGSGSSVFGIFKNIPNLNSFKQYISHLQKPSRLKL